MHLLLSSVVLLVVIFQISIVYGGYAENELRSGTYEPTWPSLNRRGLPDWFQRAKLGFFLHVGVFSVPSFGNERFWYEWEARKDPEYVQYMKENYRPGFSYREFASEFTAELFNASAVFEVFDNVVTNFVVVSGKYSDGYTLWPSKYSDNWNSVDVGPRRNFVQELSEVVRSKPDMGFGVSYSLLEWFHRLYTDEQRNNFQTSYFVEHKAWPELKELVETFEPDLLWMDGGFQASDTYWKSQEFLAWLFNSGPRKDKVVINDSWGNGTRCDRACFHSYTDQIIPGGFPSYMWVKEVSVDRQSKAHRQNAKAEDFLTIHELLTEFVTAASYNATTVFHVGVSKYGTVDALVAERLMELGRWLTLYAHVFVGTSPCRFQNDPVTASVWYTCKEYQVVNSKEVDVFAVLLEYPTNGNTVVLGALKDVYDSNSKFNLVSYGPVPAKLTADGVVVELPPKSQLEPRLKHAWVLQLKTVSHE